jgi:hypothetical protein
MSKKVTKKPSNEILITRQSILPDIKKLFTLLKMNLFLPVFLILSTVAFSQENEKKNQTFHLNGNITLTTKGLSTFPNLTLGKPAAIFDFSIGGEKFRVDPTLRFGLDGKPWTFFFWMRYQAVNTEKFGLRIGAHPAYSFKTISVTQNGKATDVLRTHQYLAAEIAPVFYLTKNINIAPYYIYSYGVDKDAVRNTNFITLMANFSSINLSDKTFLRLLAQAYFLKMDANDGFFINSTLSLNHRNFPISVSSTVNKAIDSTIPGDDFLWNINLIYRFGNSYSKQ